MQYSHHGDFGFIITEYAPCTLSDLLRENKSIEIWKLLNYIRHAALGLQYIHTLLPHGRLSIDDIYIDKDGECAKIANFELNTVTDDYVPDFLAFKGVLCEVASRLPSEYHGTIHDAICICDNPQTTEYPMKVIIEWLISLVSYTAISDRNGALFWLTMFPNDTQISSDIFWTNLEIYLKDLIKNTLDQVHLDKERIYFQNILQEEWPFQGIVEYLFAQKNSVTKDYFVHIAQFGHLLSWYGPFPSTGYEVPIFLSTLHNLYSIPNFYGDMDRNSANALLTRQEHDSHLFRLSSNKGKFTIGIRQDNQTIHCIIEYDYEKGHFVHPDSSFDKQKSFGNPIRREDDFTVIPLNNSFYPNEEV